MGTNEVINTILERENIKGATFARKIGIKPTQVYDLLTGKTKRISEDICQKILSIYPQYNRAWILSGEGEQIQQREDDAISRVIDYVNNPEKYKDYIEMRKDIMMMRV